METPTTLNELVGFFIGLINQIVPFIFAVVFLYLVWKIFDSWVLNAGDAKKIEEGKQTAIVAIFVSVLMVIVWGVVELIRSSIFGS